MIVVNVKSSMKVAKHKIASQIFLLDSGTSRSGTNNEKLLTNVELCTNITVQARRIWYSIPSIPKGEVSPLELDTVVIPDMNETLSLVYQICNGGPKNIQCVAIFTTEGCQILDIDSVREALSQMNISVRQASALPYCILYSAGHVKLQ